MLLHGNARLSPFQRALVCERVRLEGWTIEEAADAAGCSQRTVYRWLARHDAGDSMLDRSSAPHRRPTRTPAKVEAQIERLRRLRWTSTKIAATLDMAVSTVCAVLARLGLNRLWKLGPPEPPNRYCRRHAGELVHVRGEETGTVSSFPAHESGGRVLADDLPARAGRRSTSVSTTPPASPTSKCSTTNAPSPLWGSSNVTHGLETITSTVASPECEPPSIRHHGVVDR